MQSDPIAQYDVASAHGCGHVLRQILLHRLKTTFSAHHANTLSATRRPSTPLGAGLARFAAPAALAASDGTITRVPRRTGEPLKRPRRRRRSGGEAGARDCCGSAVAHATATATSSSSRSRSRSLGRAVEGSI